MAAPADPLRGARARAVQRRGVAIDANPYTISYLSNTVDSCDLDCGCVGRCCFLNAVTRHYTGATDLPTAFGDSDALADTDALTDILARLDASANQCGTENPIHARANRRKREGLK